MNCFAWSLSSSAWLQKRAATFGRFTVSLEARVVNNRILVQFGIRTCEKWAAMRRYCREAWNSMAICSSRAAMHSAWGNKMSTC